MPLLGLAQAGGSGYFDDSGSPAGKGWDEVALPSASDEHAYGLEISGDAMKPAYRDGDIIVVSPGSADPPRRSRGGENHRAAKSWSRNSSAAPPRRWSCSRSTLFIADRTLDADDVAWIARIMWASQ